jgi:acyl transferase domain-containing protein
MMVTAAANFEQGADQLPLLVQQAPIAQVNVENPPLVFMFCGQGSQYVNMGIDLYRTEPVFREQMDQCFSILKSLTGTDFKKILYPDGGDAGNRHASSLPGQPAALIQQPEFTLPVVFSFEYALAKLLMTWGIRPTVMIGYSFGEYAAACLAGVFSLEDALNMIVTRGQLIQQTPAGKMTSVTLPEHELKPLLSERLSIAIVNGPTCIVSGEKEDVEVFEKEMKQKRMICVPLNMYHAIHSRVMNPIRSAFEREIKEFRLNLPQIPFISNVTAQWINNEEVTDPGYWGEHLCSTVRFSDGLKELLNYENAVFIEIGPGRILGMMVRVHPDKKPGHMILNTVKHPQEKISDDYFLLDKLGQLWRHGQSIDWTGFYGEEKRYRVPLPGYPFEGKRYWIDEKSLNIGNGLPMFSPAPGNEQDTQNSNLSGVVSKPGTAPRSQLEADIARMWKELMGLDTVSIHDDFFQLNGSSLVATQIIARLMQQYEVQIPINRFFEKPTIAYLAEVINELRT